MRPSVTQASIVVLVGLFGFQLYARLTARRTPEWQPITPVAVGETLSDVPVVALPVGDRPDSVTLGRTVGPGCTAFLVVDSDCKGCRMALEQWASDSSWQPLRAHLSWLLLRPTDTAAVAKIRGMDPEARIAGLGNMADLRTLGIDMWPTAIVVQSGLEVIDRPAPFPDDLRISFASHCDGPPPSNGARTASR